MVQTEGKISVELNISLEKHLKQVLEPSSFSS